MKKYFNMNDILGNSVFSGILNMKLVKKCEVAERRQELRWDTLRFVFALLAVQVFLQPNISECLFYLFFAWIEHGGLKKNPKHSLAGSDADGRRVWIQSIDKQTFEMGQCINVTD